MISCRNLRDRFFEWRTQVFKFLKRLETNFERVEMLGGIVGLHSVGRNGEFDHILMEDPFWRVRRRIPQIARDHQAMVARRPVA